MSWASNVAENIFPLSVEKRDLAAALSEWQYRGEAYDTGAVEESCELCDHPEIRYQFEIVNKINGNELDVGSECIKKFPSIEVLDEKGNALSAPAARQRINRDRNRLILDAKTKSLLNSLVQLAQKDDEFDIADFEKFYKEKGAFTPKQLATLIWRFEKFNVPFNKSNFKIYIMRQKDKDSLLSLKAFQIRKMWDCLLPSQKDFLKKNGWRG